VSPASVETGTRVPLGRLLVEAGLLTEAELDDALAEQQRTKRPLGEILVERGFVSGGAVANALAEQHGGLLRTEYGVATGLKPRTSDGMSAPLPPPPALPGPPPDRGNTLEDHAAALAARFKRDESEAAKTDDAPVPALRISEPVDSGEERAEHAAGNEGDERDERDERIAALEKEVVVLEAARDKALHAAAVAIETLDGLLAESEQRRQDAEARSAALEAELEQLRAAVVEQPEEPAPAAPTAGLGRHAIVVPTPTGPELVARVGEVPAVGRELELVVCGENTRFRVARIEPAPLPGPHLDCAYLELASS